MELKTVVTTIAGQSIKLQIPADPEAVLSDAVAAVKDGEGVSDPYWCLIWDAAPHTAAAILQHKWPQAANQSALELGCGVGMAGIAARLAGFRVTLSDYSPPAVQNAVTNATMNGFDDVTGEVIDWNHPPRTQYDFIFGSDILYERRNHRPVLNVLNQMLQPGGTAWIGDMGRQALPHFVALASSQWTVTIADQNNRTLTEPLAQQFQLLKLTQR